jgi:hypothetical protein
MSELGTYHGASNHAQDLRLESFQDFNVGGGSSAPELYTIGPWSMVLYSSSLLVVERWDWSWRFYLPLLSSSDNYFIILSKAPSLTRKRVCSL